MAALSPALNNNQKAAPVIVGGVNPIKSSRGQNKPKCRQCGNVARSRCPYESCKSCCSRNQNPCHIHVLKPNSTLPDKIPSSSAAPPDHQTVEPSQSTASRVASLRQLSNSFAQFNNLNLSLRSKKQLTRKDAAAINEWRFSTLKEYKERNVEAENETFDRYMQNIDLLEEVLAVKSLEDNVSCASEPNTSPKENDNEIIITGLKLQLRSNTMRSDNARMRIQHIIDRGFKKLKMSAVDGDVSDEKHNNPSEKVKDTRAARLLTISDLIDKINKARSEEDLKSCLEMKSQLFNFNGSSGMAELQYNETHDESEIAQSYSASGKELVYSLPKLVETAEIDRETLNTIDKHFSSLQHVEEL